MKTTTEFQDWRVTTHINKAGNLTLEIELNAEMHAEAIFQKGGVFDVDGRITPVDLGPKGWASGFRKFRFEPLQTAASD